MNLHVLLFINIYFFVRFLSSSNCDKDICFLQGTKKKSIQDNAESHLMVCKFECLFFLFK